MEIQIKALNDRVDKVMTRMNILMIIGLLSPIASLIIKFFLVIPTPATPLAVPGQINALTSVNAVVSVNAPLANFALAKIAVMDAVLMSDKINTTIFDSHVHGNGNMGSPTTMPLTPFAGV